MEKEKKESAAKIAERLIREHYSENGDKLSLITKVELPRNNSNNLFAAVNKQHMEIYEYKRKNITLYETILWSDWESVIIDNFALKTNLLFESESLTKSINIRGKNKEVVNFFKNKPDIHTEILERKWYNKNLGFRSKTKWKMIIASLIYLFLFVNIANVMLSDDELSAGGNGNSQENTEEQEVKQEDPGDKEVIEAEQEANEDTAPEQEEEIEKIDLTLGEFKENWNDILKNVESDLMDDFIIDEFIDINDGEAFRFVLESGLNIEGFKYDDDEIREIYIHSDEDSFDRDSFPHAMAYAIFIGALNPGIDKEARSSILINDLDFDENLSFVSESQEIIFDDYKLSLTYYSQMDTIRLSATPLE